MEYFELEIDETGRNTLKDKPSRFNTIEKTFPTLEKVKEYLVNRYGKMPQGKSKIYVGDKTPIVVGFSHSFWSSDVSHNSKSWYQTDWICISKIKAEPIDIFTNQDQLVLDLS